MDIITILKLIVCISVNTKFKSRRVIGGCKCVIKSYFRNDQRGESSSFNQMKNKKTPKNENLAALESIFSSQMAEKCVNCEKSEEFCNKMC